MRVDDSYKVRDSMSSSSKILDGKTIQIPATAVKESLIKGFKENLQGGRQDPSELFEQLKAGDDIDEKLSSMLKKMSSKADTSSQGTTAFSQMNKGTQSTQNASTNGLNDNNLGNKSQDETTEGDVVDAQTLAQQRALNMDGMGAKHMNVDATKAANNAPINNKSHAEEIFKLADSIVDKILVSDPKHSSSQQITISFNHSSAIPQTDITLRRDLDGLLTILISSNNPKSFNKLVEAREHIIDSVQSYEDHPIRFELLGPDDLQEPEQEQQQAQDYVL